MAGQPHAAPVGVADVETVREWFDRDGWRMDPDSLKRELERRGAGEDDVLAYMDEGADLRAAAAARETPARLLQSPAEYVLGALLFAGAMSPETTATVLEKVVGAGLEPHMFPRDRDRFVYDAIVAVAGRGDPAAWNLVERELDQHGRLADAGGRAYIVELVELSPSIDNAAANARALVADARRTELEREALRLVEQARNGGVTDQLRERIVRLLEPDRAGERDRLVAGGSFILDAPEQAAAVWGEGAELLWAAGEGMMLAGPQGVGKTTILQQLALARIGLRSEVLGVPVADTGGRVLYVAADRPAQAQRSLARMVTPADRATLDERLVVHRGPLETLADQDARVLARLCGRAGCDTVMVDSVKDIAGKLVDDEIGGRINLCFQYAIAGGVELAAAHHQRKEQRGEGKPTRLDDVYGSGRITSGLGSVLLLWGEAGDIVVELTHLKQPSEPVGPWTLVHDHSKGHTTVDAKVDLADAVYRAGAQGLTAEQAASLVNRRDDPTRNQVEAARRKLGRLCDRGRLVKRDGDPPRYHADDAYADAGSPEFAELF